MALRTRLWERILVAAVAKKNSILTERFGQLANDVSTIFVNAIKAKNGAFLFPNFIGHVDRIGRLVTAKFALWTETCDGLILDPDHFILQEGFSISTR